MIGFAGAHRPGPARGGTRDERAFVSLRRVLVVLSRVLGVRGAPARDRPRDLPSHLACGRLPRSLDLDGPLGRPGAALLPGPLLVRRLDVRPCGVQAVGYRISDGLYRRVVLVPRQHVRLRTHLRVLWRSGPVSAPDSLLRDSGGPGFSHDLHSARLDPVAIRLDGHRLRSVFMPDRSQDAGYSRAPGIPRSKSDPALLAKMYPDRLERRWAQLLP